MIRDVEMMVYYLVFSYPVYSGHYLKAIVASGTSWQLVEKKGRVPLLTFLFKMGTTKNPHRIENSRGHAFSDASPNCFSLCLKIGRIYPERNI